MRVVWQSHHYLCESLPLPAPPPAAVAAILLATVAFSSDSRGEGCVAVVDEGEAERRVVGVGEGATAADIAEDLSAIATGMGDCVGLISVFARVVLLVVSLTAGARMEEEEEEEGVEDVVEDVVGVALLLGTPGMFKTVERGREKSSSDVNLEEEEEEEEKKKKKE